MHKVTGNAKTRLIKKKLHQAAQDYSWSLDEELSRLNAETPYSGPFSRYLDYYLAELDQPPSDRQTFAIEADEGRYIGNCSLYNIDYVKYEAEVGITIGDRNYWNKGYGSDALKTLVKYAFSELGLTRLYLKTLVDNYPAQHCFSKCGFRQYGTLEINGHRFITMELRREWWESNTSGGSYLPILGW